MLEICKSFFRYLDDSNIRYCHWKSNEHLLKALSGKTDLDLLVHEGDMRKFENALKKFSIKEVLSPPTKRFPEIYDYLGFDNLSGELIHLHVHYKLVLGQKYIKNHHLPVEGIIFENLVLKNDIYIPCPELELILLIIRAHMKLEVISIIKHGIKDILNLPYLPFPTEIVNEFKYLLSSISYNRFSKLLIDCNLPINQKIFLKFISKFSDNKYHFYNAVYIRSRIFSGLREMRRDKGVAPRLKYILLSLWNLSAINKLFVIKKKKRLKTNGIILSFVGADGAGKSTLIRDINRWLSWKLQTQQYYYGIPKTLTIKIASYVIRYLKKIKQLCVANLIEDILWIYVARKRYKICLKSQKNKRNGQIVITDRFPLKEFHSMSVPMDGPRLQTEESKKKTYFSKLEKDLYDRIDVPDQIFILQVPLDELRRRKTDLDLISHREKAESVNSINGSRVKKIINAEKEYADVFLKIKGLIWDIL